jgi:carboxylate-amine ligase
MSLSEPSFTIGIEEEYLLVDPQTRDLLIDPAPELLKACEDALGSQVTPEFLRAQIEVGTRVCQTLGEAHDELRLLRRTLSGIAADHGAALIAAATHPFASWQSQKHTDKERYNSLAEDMQVVARRLLTCGMHVHIGIEDNEFRIELMNQACYFLPHLLALSTSSPFWGGEETGLKSYRLAAFDELPRTGLPETFSSYGEYERTVATMVKAGLIEDGTKLWWDIRPSARFPTLEMRITDMCTLLEDTISIAALYRCLCRMLWRIRSENQSWRAYPNLLVAENRWRAMRYGLDEGLVDFGKGELVPYSDLLDEWLSALRPDAEAFGCVEELEASRKILDRGTSAHRQLRTYHDAIDAHGDKDQALRAVVDALILETMEGI